jgi:hypothetical protein
MSNRFCTNLCDVVCIIFSVTALSLSVYSFAGQFELEKSTPSSGAGFHLLSCPKLFEIKSSDFKSKYSDIRLNKESTEKLMTMLKESLEHAHVLHAGKPTSKRGIQTIYHAVEEQMGDAKEVDINIPQNNDNVHLCEILQTILDEQLDKTNNRQGQALGKGEQQVTISIMKLETQKQESFLLRGARAVRSAPILESVVKMTHLDDGLSALVAKAKEMDFTFTVRDAVMIA